MNGEPAGRKIWRILFPVVVHVVIYALVLFGASILFANQGYSGQPANELMNRYAALMTGIALVITIPVLFYFYRKDDPPRRKEEIRKPVNLLLLLALAVTASHGLSMLLSLFATGDAAASYENVENAIYASAPLFVIIRGVILAPVCEELLFRGLMFRRLKEYTNFPLAAVVSSLVFAVYHLNLIQGIFALLFGLLLCCVYDRFGNLLASIILHAAGNLLSVLLTYAGFQYPSMGLYYVAMVIWLLLAAGILYYFIRKKRTA